MPLELDGWRSRDRSRGDGAIDSAQRAVVTGRLAEPSDDGARKLGHGYWLEVQRATRGLVRCRESDRGVRLLPLGLRPALLALGPARVAVDRDRIRCSYDVLGGVLARRAGGSLTLAQTGLERAEVCIAVEGFFPRLGVLDRRFVRRFHASVSRRYLGRLVEQARS